MTRRRELIVTRGPQHLSSEPRCCLILHGFSRFLSVAHLGVSSSVICCFRPLCVVGSRLDGKQGSVVPYSRCGMHSALQVVDLLCQSFPIQSLRGPVEVRTSFRHSFIEGDSPQGHLPCGRPKLSSLVSDIRACSDGCPVSVDCHVMVHFD